MCSSDRPAALYFEPERWNNPHPASLEIYPQDEFLTKLPSISHELYTLSLFESANFMAEVCNLQCKVYCKATGYIVYNSWPTNYADVSTPSGMPSQDHRLMASLQAQRPHSSPYTLNDKSLPAFLILQ